ncbi:hypothetical protein [Streptomyces hainanensis]|uniref:Uncharacterized protein n=1 Tax=Streptomyces hainanensis TaxID=402648 RepID=A0A4R4SFI0_9ACTN|nr:hypothetical protein [Streptomyces hainanensis]TDC62158.1 hypothetical protein E1283_34570 [Streptomyces hainanensis]
MVALSGGDDDPDPGPGPTAGPTVTDEPTDDPTQDPTQEPTQDPTDEPVGGNVPAGLVGAWEGESLGGENSIFVRMEIAEGTQGDTVVTQYTVLPEGLCVEQASLASVSGDTISLTPEGITSEAPDGINCPPYSDQTALLQPDGTVRWQTSDGGGLLMSRSTTNPGRDGMPYAIFSGVYNDDDLSVEFEDVVSAGELAATFTEPDGDCVWESALVRGGTSGGNVLLGPGAVTQGDCDPLPSYDLSFTASDSAFGDDAPTVAFTPYGDDEPEFTLDRE